MEGPNQLFCMEKYLLRLSNSYTNSYAGAENIAVWTALSQVTEFPKTLVIWGEN